MNLCLPEWTFNIYIIKLWVNSEKWKQKSKLSRHDPLFHVHTVDLHIVLLLKQISNIKNLKISHQIRGFNLLWGRGVMNTIGSVINSVTKSCPTLYNPMDCRTPGFSVHHQLLEPTQTQVHRVSDAILPSHLLSSPSQNNINSSNLRSLDILSFPWIIFNFPY